MALSTDLSSFSPFWREKVLILSLSMTYFENSEAVVYTVGYLMIIKALEDHVDQLMLKRMPV